MIGFFNDIDGMILDAVFIGIIVLIAFFGIIKGFKNTFISTLLFCGSFFLGFCEYTNSLKDVLIEKVLLVNNWMPAGSDNVSVFVVNLLTPFLASLTLCILFYCVLSSLKLMFSVLFKKKSKNYYKKSKIGRVFSGFISLAIGSVVTLTAVLMLNNNTVGMKSLVEDSVVTKFVVEKSETLINKKDSNLTDKIIFKLYKGNLLVVIDDKTIESFDYVDEKASKFLNKEYQTRLADETLKNEQTKIVMKEYLEMLYNMSVLSNSFDELNENIKIKYCKMAEEIISIMSKKSENVSLGGLDISINEYAEMKITFKDAGLDEKLIIAIDDIVEEK